MSKRKNDFEKALRAAGSDIDLRRRYRRLGEEASSYLRSRYSDSAIKLIERTILNIRDKDGEVPPGLEYAHLEAAKYYSRKGEFDRAEELLSLASESRNVTVCLQSRYEADLIKLKRQLEQGTVDEEIIEEIKDVVKDDEKHELETSILGEFSDYDFFRSYFGERIPVKDLTEKIFPSKMKKPTEVRPTTESDVSPHPSNNYRYDEGLSANNRLKFLVENFQIASGSAGDGKFKGAILFEIENSDLVIVENFWRQTRDGKIVEDYGKATYILPKDQTMDLKKLSRGEIIGKDDPRIITVRHGSKEYYNNLIERFNSAQSAELQKIEQKDNPLENAETRKRETPIVETEETREMDTFKFDEETEITDEIDTPKVDKETEITDEIDTPKVDKETEIIDEIPSIENQEMNETKDNKKENNRTQRDFNAENQEFLSGINDNIGGIITPEIMEGLLKRASYSFKNLYNSKLRNGIMELLEILEVPKENMEVEAQKAFLYLRMEKNISMINSGAINEKNLDKVLDDTVAEYDRGWAFFEKHIGDGLTYNDLRKNMKIFAETGIDPLIQPQVQEAEKDDVLQASQEEIGGKNLGQEESNPKKENIDLATRCIELLEEREKRKAEQERIIVMIEEKEKLHFENQQATIKAKEEEERARRATVQAVEQEEKSGQELEDIKKEREKLDREMQELQEKISKIEDILR